MQIFKHQTYQFVSLLMSKGMMFDYKNAYTAKNEILASFCLFCFIKKFLIRLNMSHIHLTNPGNVL